MFFDVCWSLKWAVAGILNLNFLNFLLIRDKHMQLEFIPTVECTSNLCSSSCMYVCKRGFPRQPKNQPILNYGHSQDSDPIFPFSVAVRCRKERMMGDNEQLGGCKSAVGQMLVVCGIVVFHVF